MTDQENKKTSKEGESFGEAVENLLEDFAHGIESVISTVVETVESVVEEVIGGEAKTEAKSENKNVKSPGDEQKNVSSETVEEITDQRIGYAPNLPQAEEGEEEAVIADDDDKNEIEAAIAAARSTGDEPEVKKDELVADALPALPKINRARLQVQSPNRIFLYWTLAGNPFETLFKAFGNRAGNYVLVTKLINLNTKAESFAPANLEGDWWYNVRSNSAYRIDLGFYALNRPFIRLLSSNVVQTPRVSPSLRADTAADWAITRKEFLQVLENSGFANNNLRFDFETATVANAHNEERATMLIARSLAGGESFLADNFDLGELRWLFVALAAGNSYADLREHLSSELVAWLEAVLEKNPEALMSANIRNILEAIFGADFLAAFTQEVSPQQLLPAAVFGASAIHFSQIAWPKLRFPELQPARQNAPEQEDWSESDLAAVWPLSSAEFIK